jgi:Domain of Unknown Function with PDB structure (DUF3857)/Domain of Unknown Function with PDB structure (DUF3858)/Transglutaminase-like superfamily
MTKQFYLIISIMLCCAKGFSQKETAEKVKFGDITIKDFEPDYKLLDSNAQAVILYDAGSAKYEGNSESWFNVIYTYHKRVQLIHKNAFDIATIEIPLYKGENAEDNIEKLEAVTYVLENGIITKTKVDKESIFKDKATKDYTIKKFTFPNLKEGCIIEYTYRIVSPRANYLRGFYFQDKYPVIRSEYSIDVPELFNFIFLTGGYYDLKPVEVKNSYQSYYITSYTYSAYASTNRFTYNATNVFSKWVLTNLPPLVKENYTTTVKNHIAKIEFQLSSLKFPNEPPKPIMRDWIEAAKALLKDEQFGLALSEKNKWLDDDIEKLIVKNDSLSTTKNIFNFVKNNFTCTDYDAQYMPENLKKAYNAKKGNIIEINMLLVAMLKKAGIIADPVLLSTRGNGVAYEAYPILNRFNYLIAKVIIKGKEYLLDASKKRNGFNHLPEECYNGYGRIIAEMPLLIPLFADSLTETKITSIFISNSGDEKKMDGSFSSYLGYFESFNLKEELSSGNMEDYFKKIKTSYSYDIDMSNTSIDSLKIDDEKVSVKYDFSFKLDEDIVYFNPLLTEAYKTNPFTATTRNYPVEMPYATREIININIEIPKGYKVDELPKSARVKLNEDDGMFEYIIQTDSENIQLRCRLDINKANFSAQDYESLREFYSYVVKKQSEQIVFKKIK